VATRNELRGRCTSFLLGQALLGRDTPGEAAACFEAAQSLLEGLGAQDKAAVIKQALLGALPLARLHARPALGPIEAIAQQLKIRLE